MRWIEEGPRGGTCIYERGPPESGSIQSGKMQIASLHELKGSRSAHEDKNMEI